MLLFVICFIIHVWYSAWWYAWCADTCSMYTWQRSHLIKMLSCGDLDGTCDPQPGEKLRDLMISWPIRGKIVNDCWFVKIMFVLFGWSLNVKGGKRWHRINWTCGCHIYTRTSYVSNRLATGIPSCTLMYHVHRNEYTIGIPGCNGVI
jgi:hypothetical protein